MNGGNKVTGAKYKGFFDAFCYLCYFWDILRGMEVTEMEFSTRFRLQIPRGTLQFDQGEGIERVVMWAISENGAEI